MPLLAGSRVGSYEILCTIGAGGMGEVYRARDTRLDRDVAIKILPELFAADPERLTRFEREAKALAALNHPNIAHIHGIEDSGGSRALVMELVEGEDLAARLAGGPIPVADALLIAKQIADALDAAHGRGIIHRDLKPANIRITDDGTVKVLDFGLAKAADPSRGPAADTVDSPTFTSPATALGVILGTAAYMAPEQAKGKAVDKRADIWAFGVLLYEMLTGRRVFDGASTTELLAAVMRDEPDWTALPDDTPPSVRLLLSRCLAKDPKHRLRDIGDARLELERPQASETTPSFTGQSSRHRMLAAVSLLIVACTIAGWLVGRATARTEQAPSYELRRLTELPGAERHPDISPDGRQVIYASAASGNQDVYVLRVGGDRAINLTASSAADDNQPSFSSDGQSIAFRSEREGGGLFIMGATGESVRRVTTAGHDPAWSPDGRFLVYSTEATDDPYSRGSIAELWKVEIATGATTRLTTADGVQPAWSPEGSRIAYWANTKGQRDIWTVGSDGSPPVPVTEDAATDWSPSWSSDGHWLYFSSDRGGAMNLWRIKLDRTTGRPLNDPEQVTAGVRPLGHARVAASGRIAVMAYDRVWDLDLYRLDAAAAPQHVTTLRPRSMHWCWPSPDGSWLACSTTGSPEDIILLRPDGSEMRRLTNDVFKDRGLVWHPDGQSVAFYSTRSGDWDFWSIRTDGSGLRQLSSLGEVNNLAWSPDGTEAIAVAQYNELWRFPIARLATRESARSLAAPVPGFRPLAWSPTGNRLVGVEIGQYAIAQGIGVWELDSNHYRPMKVPTVGSDRGEPGIIGGWLPDSRRFIARSSDGVVIVDAVDGSARVLLPASPLDMIALSRDGRTLLVEREKFDSDIWMFDPPSTSTAQR